MEDREGGQKCEFLPYKGTFIQFGAHDSYTEWTWITMSTFGKVTVNFSMKI